jgi:hypothetical protein
MSSNPNPSSSSSSSTDNQLLLKLTGANYTTCSTKMEILLVHAGLRLIVSQRKLRPTPTTPSGISTGSSRTLSNTAGPSSDDNDAAVQMWDEDAERATAKIFLYLDE